MNTSMQIVTLILLVLYTSCVRQTKTESAKNNNKSQAELVDAIGAPKSITRNIKEDRNGNIWFATWEGIIKYNGDSFNNVTDSVSLNRFFSVLEDRNGNFWFGSIGLGVYYYDGKTFTNFTTSDGLVNNIVTNIFEDRRGNIWFGTEGGASRYDGKTFRNFTTADGLSNNDVNSIIEDKNGRFWFGTRGDACIYDGTTFKVFRNKEGKTFQNVRHIVEDRKGIIWLGGNNGLWNYNDNTFKKFTTDFVGYVYEDKKGNIWTSSESTRTSGWALSRYDEALLNTENPSVTEIITGQGMLFGILEDTNETIWVGSLNGVLQYN